MVIGTRKSRSRYSLNQRHGGKTLRERRMVVKVKLLVAISIPLIPLLPLGRVREGMQIGMF